jgi:aminoglycoside phosphotransferase (APT) family kinase protein
VTYGFELSPADRRLLRSPPPGEALRWCAAAIGPRARVVRVAALDGGLSSAVHAVDVESAAGAVHQLVLRRYVRRSWLEEEPDAPEREAAVLERLREGPVPAPQPVALDAEGAPPMLLMTRLPGRIDWEHASLGSYLRRLAEALPPIHATPAAGVRDYDPYELEASGPPRWSSRPEVWERAFEVFNGPPPAHERAFVHRDYHPGNVLWTAGEITGIVDWPSASAGAPSVDVGHCRMDLARDVSLETADRFLELYRTISGRDDHHPYWDVVAAVGGFSEDDWSPADEDFLAAALARL